MLSRDQLGAVVFGETFESLRPHDRQPREEPAPEARAAAGRRAVRGDAAGRRLSRGARHEPSPSPHRRLRPRCLAHRRCRGARHPGDRRSRVRAARHGPMPAPGPGRGRGLGPMAGIHAQQVQQETVIALVAVALVAAAVASMLGFLMARERRPTRSERSRMPPPPSPAGDLGRRSGLADADRRDRLARPLLRQPCRDPRGYRGGTPAVLPGRRPRAQDAARRHRRDDQRRHRWSLRARRPPPRDDPRTGPPAVEDRGRPAHDRPRRIGRAAACGVPPVPLEPLLAELASAFGAAAAAAGGSVGATGRPVSSCTPTRIGCARRSRPCSTTRAARSRHRDRARGVTPAGGRAHRGP